MTETKKLTGFKLSEGKRMIIKRRAVLKNVGMQDIFNEMVDKYFAEEPMNEEEKAIMASTN